MPPCILVFNNIRNELINFFSDLFKIIKNKRLILIWFLILPINIVISIINVIIIIIYYIKLMITFIIKIIQKKLKYKNIKPIKINKKKIYFNNYILQSIYFLTVDLSIKKSFLLFYNQIFFLQNFNKKEINLLKKLENFFELFLFVIFRKTIFYLTCIPFIILKNNNELTLLIYDVNNMNIKNTNIYLSTLLANLIKDFNLINNFETKKLKIKFDKKKVYLNPKKPIDLIDLLQDINKLTIGTKQLIKSGRIAMIKYNITNKSIIKSHPTLLYETVDTYNSNEPAYFSINQSTKKYLEIGEEIKKDFLIKNKIENEIEMKGILNKEVTAYVTAPYLVHKNIAEFVGSEKLIKNWGKHENWIKQFNMVQTFLLNLDNKMLKINKNHGIIIDKNYKNVRDYIEKNYLWFNKNTQMGLENVINFYDKNKSVFMLNNNRLDFKKCLLLAEVDPEVKNLFKTIILKYQ